MICRFFCFFAVITLLLSACGQSPEPLVTPEPDPNAPPPEIEEAIIEADQPESAGLGGWWGVRDRRQRYEPLPATDPAAVGAFGEPKLAGGGDTDYKKALKLIAAHDYAGAKELLLQVSLKNPDNSGVWRRLADCEYNLQKHPEAIRAYERAINLSGQNYFALRGLGFSRLHYGNEMWRAQNPAQAHEEYKLALRQLQDCMRLYPADLEAAYGRSMAAEGASRRLYLRALTELKAGNRQKAEAVAYNCIQVIDEGAQAAQLRLDKSAKELGPQMLKASLFQRRAMLLSKFDHIENALQSMDKAVRSYRAALQIAPNNDRAKKAIEDGDTLVEAWQKKLDREVVL